MSKKSNISKEEIGYFFLSLIPVSSGIYVGFRLAAYKDGVLLEGKSHPNAWPVFVGAVVTMAIVTAIIIGICCVVQWLAGKLRGDHPAEAIQEEDKKDIEKRRIARARGWCLELGAIDEQKYKIQRRREEPPPQKTAEQIDRETVAEYQNQSIREDPCLGSDLVVFSDCECPLPAYLFIDHKYSGKRGGCPHCGGIPRFKDRQPSKDEENASFQSELREDILTLAIILCFSVAIPSVIAIGGGMTWLEAVVCAVLLFAIILRIYYGLKRGEIFWS